MGALQPAFWPSNFPVSINGEQHGQKACPTIEIDIRLGCLSAYHVGEVFRPSDLLYIFNTVG